MRLLIHISHFYSSEHFSTAAWSFCKHKQRLFHTIPSNDHLLMNHRLSFFSYNCRKMHLQQENYVIFFKNELILIIRQ